MRNQASYRTTSRPEVGAIFMLPFQLVVERMYSDLAIVPGASCLTTITNYKRQ